MRRLLPSFAAVILATGIVMALSVAAMAVPATMVDHVGSGEPEPIELGPLAQRSYVYAADGSLMAALKDEENRQPVPLGRGAARTWSTPSWRSRTPGSGSTTATTSGACCGPSGQRRLGRHQPGRLDHHPAAREAQPAERRADARPQGAGDRPRPAARAADDEGRDPRPLPEHRLLRQPRLRHPGRGRDLLRRGGAAARRGPGGHARRHHPQPDHVQPRALPRAGRRAPASSPSTAWSTPAGSPRTRGRSGRRRRRRRSSTRSCPPPTTTSRPRSRSSSSTIRPFAMLGETEDRAPRGRVPRGPAGLHHARPGGAGSRRWRPATPSSRSRTASFPSRGSTRRPASPTGRPAAVVSVEPATGAVRTMVGGPGFDSYKYNLATQNPRDVGSSFKTFVLATIMEQGYSPDDIINGIAPCNFADESEEGGIYDVSNFADGGGIDGHHHRGHPGLVELRLRAARPDRRQPERRRHGPPARHPAHAAGGRGSGARGRWCCRSSRCRSASPASPRSRWPRPTPPSPTTASTTRPT